METEGQNVKLIEYALQYHDVKKYDTSGMWSILYQYTSEKFPHIFLMTKLCLYTPYSNEFVKKISKALLLIKVENPEIE